MRLLAAALLLLILLATPLPLLSADAGKCAKIDVPAVESQSGRGSVVGVAICIAPGNNVLRIYGADKIESDTLISIVTAYIIAQLLSGQPRIGYDIDISFERYVQDVSGPSAGVLMTVALYSLLSSSNKYRGLSGTGAINLDGSIEAVGGIPQKLSALRASGYREVFLPVASYIQYRQSIQQFGDLVILPVGSIVRLLDISPPSFSLEAGEDYVMDVISNVSKSHGVFMKDLLESLMNIYMSRVSDTGSEEYRVAINIMNIIKNDSPEEGYALINLYYLSLTQLFQAIVNKDPNGYGKILIQRAVDEYNRSISRLAAAFSDIPRVTSLDILLLYLIIFERAVNLTGYESRVRAYMGSGDPGSIVGVAGTLYGRALSIEYWLDILGNITRSTGMNVDLGEVYKISENILRTLGISNTSEAGLSNIVRAIGSKADLEGLGMLNTVYMLYSYLQNYSYIVRSSTLSQVISVGLGARAGTNALDQLRGSGYMIDMLGIIGSGVARSIYSFSQWGLRNIDPQSQETMILLSSLASTSASALSLNTIYMIFSKKVNIPLSLEFRGEAKSTLQSPTSNGSSNIPTTDLNMLSNLLALASMAVAVITLIYTIALSPTRRPDH